MILQGKTRKFRVDQHSTDHASPPRRLISLVRALGAGCRMPDAGDILRDLAGYDRAFGVVLKDRQVLS
jgi:hypothetical protein